MSGILKRGPAMDPFRLIYMTGNGVSRTKRSIVAATLTTLIIEYHAKQESDEVLPG